MPNIQIFQRRIKSFIDYIAIKSEDIALKRFKKPTQYFYMWGIYITPKLQHLIHFLHGIVI